MPDLADRISRAAVAALDLAPFDDRYSRLSRQVLAGGASRFQRVTADDQAVHFVIPVGLAGERIDYGALVLQDRQAGILWRDALGLDHSVVVPRSDAAATFSSLTLNGEPWMRFDVEGSGEQMAFLVPPVSDPLLRRTLIDFFSATPGHRNQPEGGVAPIADPDPAPAVRFPDPEPDPVEATAVLPVADAEAWDEPTDAPAEPALEATEIPEGEPLAPADQFAVAPADLNEWAPEATPEPDTEAEPVEDHHTDLEATQVHALEETQLHPPAHDESTDTDPTPEMSGPEPVAEQPTEEDLDATRVRPVDPEGQPAQHRDAPFDLYRDDDATPAWSAATTQAIPAAPAPEASPWAQQQPAPEGWQQAPASAAVRPAETAPVYAQPSGTSRTLVGFLLGLFATLTVGGIVIISNLLG